MFLQYSVLCGQVTKSKVLGSSPVPCNFGQYDRKRFILFFSNNSILILIGISNTLSLKFYCHYYYIIINLKDRRLNSGSNSRLIIGSDFGANIISQYRPAIIIQASIDHRSNIDSQHRLPTLRTWPIIGPIILSYLAFCLSQPSPTRRASKSCV